PLHQELFDAISQNSNIIHSSFNSNSQATQHFFSNHDDSEQLSNVARLAYNIMEREPHSRIAIVVPDLVNKRNKVVSALNDVFEPQVVLPGTPQYTQPYNVSAGIPLCEAPLVHMAINLL